MNGSLLLRLSCLLALALALTLAAGCGEEPVVEPPPEAPQQTVIEAGVNNNPDPDDPLTEPDPQQPGPDPNAPPEESTEAGFTDKGEATTLEDLMAAQAKIESFYFEQSLTYPDGKIFLQVWYKDERMKLISSEAGYSLQEVYYDYVDNTVVTFSPGSGEAAWMMEFDELSEDAPDNPVREDLSGYTVVGSETIDRQLCLILETPQGELLWISTLFGFPMQAEFTDSLGTRMTSQYKNLRINTVSDDEVLPPADMEIYRIGDNG